MLQQRLCHERVVLLRCEAWLRLNVLLCGSVQVLLALAIQEDLVDRLAKEAFIEAAKAVFLIRLVDDFDEITLLQQSD